MKNRYFDKCKESFGIVHNKNASMFIPSVVLLLLGVFSIGSSISMAEAQGNQVFRVIVEVTNNGNTDEHGAVFVDIDGSLVAKVLSGQSFPAKQTVSFPFEFGSSDVPVGTGFVAEVVYGDDDDIHKRAYGQNSPSNAPETVSISIP